MSKIIILVVIGLFIFGVLTTFLILHQLSKKEKPFSETKQYAGPVRPTDDEQYFRQTGITRPLNNGDN